MRNWIYMLLLAATALFFPSRGMDIGKLIPVELVALRVENGVVVAETDTGDSGEGKDIDEAMENLRAGASGEIFLDTADYLLLSATFRESREQLERWFRPGTLVYAAEDDVDPEKAAAYLQSRTGGLPLNQLEKAVPLETIIRSGGGVRLEE